MSGYSESVNAASTDPERVWYELAIDVHAEAVEPVSELLGRYGFNHGVAIDEPYVQDGDGDNLQIDVDKPFTIRTWVADSDFDPALAEVAAEYDAALVCTHTGGLAPRTPPHRMSYDDVVRSAIDDTVAVPVDVEAHRPRLDLPPQPDRVSWLRRGDGHVGWGVAARGSQKFRFASCRRGFSSST